MPTERRREADPLQLEPRLKVKRLNRLAVLCVAILGILVLWIGYFVLTSRAPNAAQPAQPPSPAAARERAAIERLERLALPQESPAREARSLSRPAAPPAIVPPTSPSPSPAANYRRPPRRPPAYEADVIVAEFQQASLASRSPSADAMTARLAEAAISAGGSLLAGPEANTVAAPTSPSQEDPHGAFLQQARDRSPQAPRYSTLRQPLSPFLLSEGTLIPAILTAGIHSDLPGQTAALVRRDVYDSLSGRHLLIPRGTRLVGEYDHRVAWGQKRVLLAWHRLILPDGTSLAIDGLPGVDTAAMTGLRDRVDHHFVRTFGSALLLSAVSAGAQLSQPQESADGGAPSARQLVAAAIGQELGRVTAEITRRNVDRQPTLRIRPGYLFHVELNGDLVLPGSYPLPPLAP